MADHRRRAANELRNEQVLVHRVAGNTAQVQMQVRHAVAAAQRLHLQVIVRSKRNLLDHNRIRVGNYRRRGAVHRNTDMCVAIVWPRLRRLVQASSYRVKPLVIKKYRQLIVGHRVHGHTVDQLDTVVLEQPRHRPGRKHRVERREIEVRFQRAERVGVADIVADGELEDDDAVAAVRR